MVFAPNMVFPPIWGKNGGVLSMRMQVILDSLFARPGSAPIWGGKKGEFRDWTSTRPARSLCLGDGRYAKVAETAYATVRV